MYDGTKKASTESTEEFLAILTAYMDSNIVTKYFGLKTILYSNKQEFSADLYYGVTQNQVIW